MRYDHMTERDALSVGKRFKEGFTLGGIAKEDGRSVAETNVLLRWAMSIADVNTYREEIQECEMSFARIARYIEERNYNAAYKEACDNISDDTLDIVQNENQKQEQKRE